MGSHIVQSNDNSSASTASLVVTLGGSFQVGDTILAYAGAAGGIAITGGGVSAWSLDATSGSHVPMGIWSGVITTPGVTTVTFTLTAGPIAAWVVEWAGLLILDQHTAATGTATPIAPGSITPTTAGQIIAAAGNSQAAITAGPTGGFTDLGLQAPAGLGGFDAAYLIQGAPAAVNPNWTTTTAGWDAAIASYIPPADITVYQPVIRRLRNPLNIH